MRHSGTKKRKKKSAFGWLGLVLSTMACGSVSEAPVAETSAAATVVLTEVRNFGSNPGALTMFEYVPPGLASAAPLVVVLHGCSQSAREYATRSDWNALADRLRFAVVYAEQPGANNPARCFTWFETNDISRDRGEALSIKQMVDKARDAHAIDPARVFVTGLSAGGYMTEVMLATYPELFAGGAVMAGGPYRCAASAIETSRCQQGNVSKTPAEWASLVRQANPGYGGPYPRVAVFHGSSDIVVKPPNMVETVEQWTHIHGLDATPELREQVHGATHEVHRDAEGRSLVESWLVPGMGHGISVDPGNGADQGGATGSYSEDRNLFSSYYAALFFGLVPVKP